MWMDIAVLPSLQGAAVLRSKEKSSGGRRSESLPREFAGRSMPDGVDQVLQLLRGYLVSVHHCLDDGIDEQLRDRGLTVQMRAAHRHGPRPPGLPFSLGGGPLLAEIPRCEIPVEQVSGYRANVVCTTVLVVEVVGVLPHINGKQRDLAVGERGVGVRGRG